MLRAYILASALVVGVFTILSLNSPALAQVSRPPQNFLGFDVNEYPGDAALPSLKQTFAFSGYWLNTPPGGVGEASDWTGKRPAFIRNGFGFLVLFNGRLDRELKSRRGAAALGVADAISAVTAARHEGFPAGTIIFLDQEEGGRLLPEQMTYVLNWVDTVNTRGFRAGIYCSGISAKEGKSTVITADDIREHEAKRKITYFIYNDACPPSPGCVYAKDPPSPAESGVPFAAIWQFAQSPRRHEFTKRCAATYSSDGSCYPPAHVGATTSGHDGAIYLDLDSASSPDPSNGR